MKELITIRCLFSFLFILCYHLYWTSDGNMDQSIHKSRIIKEPHPLKIISMKPRVSTAKNAKGRRPYYSRICSERIFVCNQLLIRYWTGSMFFYGPNYIQMKKYKSAKNKQITTQFILKVNSFHFYVYRIHIRTQIRIDANRTYLHQNFPILQISWA